MSRRRHSSEVALGRSGTGVRDGIEGASSSVASASASSVSASASPSRHLPLLSRVRRLLSPARRPGGAQGLRRSSQSHPHTDDQRSGDLSAFEAGNQPSQPDSPLDPSPAQPCSPLQFATPNTNVLLPPLTPPMSALGPSSDSMPTSSSPRSQATTATADLSVRMEAQDLSGGKMVHNAMAPSGFVRLGQADDQLSSSITTATGTTGTYSPGQSSSTANSVQNSAANSDGRVSGRHGPSFFAATGSGRISRLPSATGSSDSQSVTGTSTDGAHLALSQEAHTDSLATHDAPRGVAGRQNSTVLSPRRSGFAGVWLRRLSLSVRRVRSPTQPRSPSGYATGPVSPTAFDEGGYDHREEYVEVTDDVIAAAAAAEVASGEKGLSSAELDRLQMMALAAPSQLSGLGTPGLAAFESGMAGPAAAISAAAVVSAEAPAWPGRPGPASETATAVTLPAAKPSVMALALGVHGDFDYVNVRSRADGGDLEGLLVEYLTRRQADKDEEDDTTTPYLLGLWIRPVPAERTADDIQQILVDFCMETEFQIHKCVAFVVRQGRFFLPEDCVRLWPQRRPTLLSVSDFQVVYSFMSRVLHPLDVPEPADRPQYFLGSKLLPFGLLAEEISSMSSSAADSVVSSEESRRLESGGTERGVLVLTAPADGAKARRHDANSRKFAVYDEKEEAEEQHRSSSGETYAAAEESRRSSGEETVLYSQRLAVVDGKPFTIMSV